MQADAGRLDIIGDAVAEAVRLHGSDWVKVKRHVETRLETLAADDRRALSAAVEEILSFRAPDWPLMGPH
jgi:hypothetical protein